MKYITPTEVRRRISDFLTETLNQTRVRRWKDSLFWIVTVNGADVLCWFYVSNSGNSVFRGNLKFMNNVSQLAPKTFWKIPNPSFNPFDLNVHPDDFDETFIARFVQFVEFMSVGNGGPFDWGIFDLSQSFPSYGLTERAESACRTRF